MEKGRSATVTGAPKRQGRRQKAHRFYAAALSAAERELLEAASQVGGLEEEIALLRARLWRLIQEHPENTTLLLKVAELLVRALGAEYRMSKQPQKELMDSIVGVLRGVGEVLGMPLGGEGGTA